MPCRFDPLSSFPDSEFPDYQSPGEHDFTLHYKNRFKAISIVILSVNVLLNTSAEFCHHADILVL